MELLTMNADIFIKLLLAVIFGSLLGIERAIAHKKAGMRTYALVTMGSCLFVLVSEYLTVLYAGTTSFDPSKIPSEIIVGIGFLGAGLIIFQGKTIQGLTTAAGLWVAAAIGMALGFGLYPLAFIALIFTLLIFTVFWRVEHRLSADQGGTEIGVIEE